MLVEMLFWLEAVLVKLSLLEADLLLLSDLDKPDSDEYPWVKLLVLEFSFEVVVLFDFVSEDEVEAVAERLAPSAENPAETEALFSDVELELCSVEVDEVLVSLTEASIFTLADCVASKDSEVSEEEDFSTVLPVSVL